MLDTELKVCFKYKLSEHVLPCVELV